MDIQQIFNNNAQWIKDILQNDSEYFDRIPKNQTPEILYIGCSDSRIKAENFMGLKEGDVFVHRNIANMVNLHDVSLKTIIYFAVNQLKVNHIVVCGHYGCGGVKAAMESMFSETLEGWIGTIRQLHAKNGDKLRGLNSKEEEYEKLIELNVLQQCNNLKEFKVVQDRLNKNDITIHGWVYDPFSGGLKDLNFKND